MNAGMSHSVQPMDLEHIMEKHNAGLSIWQCYAGCVLANGRKKLRLIPQVEICLSGHE